MIPYDAAGRLIGSKDPLDGRTAYAYDALGNLSRVSENGNGAEYFYDPAGNLIGMKDAEGRAAARSRWTHILPTSRVPAPR